VKETFLDRNREAVSRQTRRTAGLTHVQASFAVGPIIQRGICTVRRPLAGLAYLRPERTVLLDFFNLVLGLELVSLSLRFSLGFRELAPPLLFRLLVVTASLIDERLEGALGGKLLLCLSYEVKRLFSLRLAHLAYLACHGRPHEGGVAHCRDGGLARLWRHTHVLSLGGRFIFWSAVLLVCNVVRATLASINTVKGAWISESGHLVFLMLLQVKSCLVGPFLSLLTVKKLMVISGNLSK